MDKWKCLICGKPKPPTQRYKTKSGWQSYCRACTVLANKLRADGKPVPKAMGVSNILTPMSFEEKRTRIHEQRNAYLRKLRNDVYTAYGQKCNCCGEDESLFFELDHVNGGGRQEAILLKGTAAIYAKARREGYPKIYQLLCANCNQGRARNGGICPHKS